MVRRTVTDLIAGAIGAGVVLLVSVLYLPQVLDIIEPRNRYLLVLTLAIVVVLIGLVAARRRATAGDYARELVAAAICAAVTFFWAYPASQTCGSDIETGGRIVCTTDLGLALFFTAVSFLGAAGAAAIASVAVSRDAGAARSTRHA